MVSDWEDIKRLYTRDKVAKSAEEAVKIAVMSGIDMSMVPYDFSFYDICVNLCKNKSDQEFANRVNNAAERILRVKEKLGLWSNQSLYPVKEELAKVGSDEAHAKNLEAAHEAIILAKNEASFLPLNKSDAKKILVTGLTGNSLKCLNGGWTYTWQGENEANNKNFGRANKLSVFDAIKSKRNSTQYLLGLENVSKTVEQAKAHDIIVLAVGEETYTETPGNINDLRLNEEQYELARALYGLSKPVVLVYLGGRPRLITEIARGAKAVLLGFLPGNRGGEAIADVLFGEYNPDGRLPMTYPLSSNGFVTHDRKPLEDLYEPLYPYGKFV